MSRRLMARSRHLAKCPLSVSATYTTTLPIRPSLLVTSRFHSSHPTSHDSRLTWTEWISGNPTSVEEMQTVYNACVQSTVFKQRPITPDGTTPFGVSKQIRHRDDRFLESTFMETPGLKPQDWKARGIQFPHAVDIARQLQLYNYFSGNNVEDLIREWPLYSATAKANATLGLAIAAKTVAEGRKRLMERNSAEAAAIKKNWNEERKESDMPSGARQIPEISKQGEPTGRNQAHRFPKGGEDGEHAGRAETDQARRILRQRKKAELASDAAEGIKSKRRPLRLATVSKGVPLVFENMKKLHRVERGGREIAVDKEVKQRTKGLNMERTQRKRDKTTREDGTMSKGLNGNDDGSPREQRSSASLEKIRKLAKRPTKALAAIIEEKQSSLEENMPKSRRNTAERQLARAKQALALKEWEARRGQRKSGRDADRDLR